MRFNYRTKRDHCY